MMPSFRPLREFSFRIHPPDQWLMAVLKAYIDDSGDQWPGHTALSMAGYIATIEEWDRFEQAWIRVLTEFEAPYLHMKEFKERYGAFKTWPPSKEKDADFLAKLTVVIGNAGLRAFGSVVVLDDIKRLRHERTINIQAKPIAIYTSLIELRALYPRDELEVVLDRTNDAAASVADAEKYAASHPVPIEFPTFTILSKSGPCRSKSMPPLQAADFLAWEIRKEYELKRQWYQANPEGFYHILPIRNQDMSALRGLFKWFLEDRRAYIRKQGMESVNIPFEPHRRSLIALDVATPINAHIWNYHALEKLHAVKGGAWGQ